MSKAWKAYWETQRMLPRIIERLKLRYVSKEKRLSNSSLEQEFLKRRAQRDRKDVCLLRNGGWECSGLSRQKCTSCTEDGCSFSFMTQLWASLGLISLPFPHPGLCFSPAGLSTNPRTIQATSYSEAFNLHFLHGNDFCCAETRALTLKGRGDSLFWSIDGWPWPGTQS